jgi:hypothetical protein
MKDLAFLSPTDGNESQTNHGNDIWKGLIHDPFGKLEEFKQMVSTAFMKFGTDSSSGIKSMELLPMLNDLCELQNLSKPGAPKIGTFFAIKKTAFIVECLGRDEDNKISLQEILREAKALYQII